MKYLIIILLLIYCIGCASQPHALRSATQSREKYSATHKEKIKEGLKVVYKTIVKHPPLDREGDN